MSSKPPNRKQSYEERASPYAEITRISSDQESRGWQNDMLQALKRNATPEPIRLACMTNLPSRPSFFQEEFHGRIPREKAEELLSANGPVNGRYLVRESNSSPGDYSLSLSYDGRILHYRLKYENERYFTDEKESKCYTSITDLVVDVLSMYRLVHNVGGRVPKEEKKKTNSFPHLFKPHSYKHFKWCAFCGGFLWGLRDQGMKCEGCGLDVHGRCMKHVGEECTKKLPLKEKKEPRRKFVPISSRTKSVSNEIFKPTCEYQESCIRFLSHLNIPSQYFAVDALNPCYCEECCVDVDTPLCKTGDPPQMYSLPTGWCRFQLAPVCSEAESDIISSTWNLAFLSLDPEEVTEILRSKFTENRSNDSSQEGSKPLIKLTPSIICADLDARKLRYADSDSGESKAGQVVLQAYIEPYSYQMMRRPGSTEEIDPYFKMDSIYWVTRQALSIIPFALLVKTMDATYLKL